MDHSPTSPPLLPTAPARRGDRYAALSISTVSLIGLALVLPYAGQQWPRLIAFVPASDTGLALIYLITATLLMGQFVQLRTPSPLVLSCGYLFACFIVIAHLLSDAQALRVLRPMVANPMTTAWLSALWHGVFPIFVMQYAILSRSARDMPLRPQWLLPAAALTVGLAFGLAAAGTAIAISGFPHRQGLPYDDRAFRTASSIVTWLISALALGVLYTRTKAGRILDLWLCVVLVAWMLDIFLGGLIGARQYSVAWYAGRIYGILAGGLILSALLLETGSLYARLTRALAEMNAQSAALVESEAALRQAQKMEAIGQITGGVAHDFNNLLTVIIGSLDMLEQRPDGNARSARLTDYAMQAALKGEKLTKQLLAFSRRQMLNPEIRDPNRLIREFDGLMRRAIGEAVRMDLHLSPGVGSVLVDPAQFESAILNLAVNARDAMDGVGVITLETRLVANLRDATKILNAPSAPYVVIAMSDTGMGIAPDKISRVFEPFFTTKPPGKGSGLGLSQVYGFATSSKGFVTIDSTLAEGTTIRIYLPKFQDEARQASPIAERERAPRANAGEIVLIVEDEPGVLAMAIESLSMLGYGVLTATIAREALDHLRAGGRVDLLFSDIVMPDGMNGVELAIEARGRWPDLNILLTSGYAAGALTNPGILPADVQIIPKPYRLEELAQKARAVIDAGRSRKSVRPKPPAPI